MYKIIYNGTIVSKNIIALYAMCLKTKWEYTASLTMNELLIRSGTSKISPLAQRTNFRPYEQNSRSLFHC